MPRSSNRRRRESSNVRTLPTQAARIARIEELDRAMRQTSDPLALVDLYKEQVRLGRDWEAEDSRQSRRTVSSNTGAARNLQPNLNKNPQAYRAPKLYIASSPAQAPQKVPKIAKQSRLANTICEVRKDRKEVMFATNKAGKRGQKKPVWRPESKIICRNKK